MISSDIPNRRRSRRFDGLFATASLSRPEKGIRQHPAYRKGTLFPLLHGGIRHSIIEGLQEDTSDTSEMTLELKVTIPLSATSLASDMQVFAFNSILLY